MQENFIDELESRGKENIKDKEDRIGNLLNEENRHMGSNEELGRSLIDVNGKLEKFSGATSKLRKLGDLKGKISNKVATITKGA
jgi:hypothetical protein